MFLLLRLCDCGAGWGVCSEPYLFPAVFHYFFYPSAEVLRRHKRLFRLFAAPYLDGVVHADKSYRLRYSGELLKASGYKETTVRVECYHLGVGNELSENLLMIAVLAVEFMPQSVHLCVPYGAGVEHQARLEYVFAHDKEALVRVLQLLTEGGGQKSSALGVGFCFYIAEKAHTYILI